MSACSSQDAEPAPAPGSGRSALIRIVRDAFLIAFGSMLVAIGVNAFRPGGLPWVARKEYAILVPCPEPVGDARPLEPRDPRVLAGDSLRIDARSAGEYSAWHLPEALHLPFDWLGPPPDEEVRVVARNVATTGARRVVVYGDGDDPDSGREWARLLAGARLKNVFYVEGGAPSLRRGLAGGSP